MTYYYEAIHHHLEIPVKIFTHTVDQYPYHWHEEMEILFVLKGAMEIRVDQRSYQLKTGDLFVVNPSEIHIIKSSMEYGQTHLLALQISMDYFRKFQLELSGKNFRFETVEAKSDQKLVFHQIRMILAEMMQLVLNKEPLYHLSIEKHLIELMVLLLKHFEVQGSSGVDRTVRSEARLLEILKYINEHCTESAINLDQIADHFYLNPQYVSRYFKRHMGVSLKKFIDSMRLNKSLYALQLSDERILDIALNHGFPDAKAYYRVFKEVLGMTPMAYRELHQLELSKQHAKDYFSINSKETLAELFQYIGIEDNFPRASALRIPTDVVKESTVHLKKWHKRIDPSWTRLLTFGYAPHGLRNDFVRQLESIQKDIGFQYVRFHGIFADELLVFNTRPDGHVYYNFNHVDALLDTLLSNAIKPFIELGFMPSDLASEDATIFWWKSNISPPKSMGHWINLVSSFIRHLVNRYGIAEVRTWYFEFWNEPDVEQFFWKGTQKDFFEFYEATYRCIKAIDPLLRLGGFGNILFWNTESWLRDFSEFMRHKGLKLDFFSFHVYNLQMASSEANPQMLMALNTSYRDALQFSELAAQHGARIGHRDYLTQTIDKMLKFNEEFSLTDGDCWITEWNANVDSRDLLHDTCYMAAFILKNCVENYEKVRGMGFWTFTDLFEEHRIEQPLFHGGFGLMTYNGIKKASYHAFAFLSKMQSTVVYADENTLITCNEENYQILLFNYCHTNQLYAQMDYSQVTPLKRYEAFEAGNTLALSLQLEAIHGTYRIEKSAVNRDFGSAFDAWVRMGAPDQLTPLAFQSLNASAEPAYSVWEEAYFGTGLLNTRLAAHEIQLFQLTKKYT